VLDDHAGAFEFVHVIPGDYFIAAADHIAEGDRADPAFLENLRVVRNGSASIRTGRRQSP
jgi:hypothetical protein